MMGGLAFLKGILGGRRQAPHQLAIFVVQFAPPTQAAGAAARTLIAKLHW
jgi:hypothetical protein